MFKLSLIFLLINFFSSISLAQSPRLYQYDPLDNMPIMEPQIIGFAGTSPIEKRGPEYRKFLSASVKIGVSGSSGSGTIVYYDSSKNIAYVATCGHMWNRGIMSVEEGKRRNMTCRVIVWYHNDKKLDEPVTYNAKVIFYSYVSGQDTALVTFTPDWIPDYFPIAPVDYKYINGKHAHSLGCDGGSEVAHYDIEIIGIRGNDLITNKNSPRPGRSGGGLMDDYGYYIGTCWGTQYRDGSGIGYFTPLSAIHRFWDQQKGYEFLLNQKPGGVARQIPVIDIIGLQGSYKPEYILLPSGR